MSYVCPPSLEEALLILSRESRHIVCGGTDCYASAGMAPGDFDWMDISRIDSLNGISLDDSEIVIGAATTWRELGHSALLPAVLREAARQIGSIQIQQVASIGGNLCNAASAADGVPALLALDAVVELASSTGVRCLALSDFIVGRRCTRLASSELLTAVRFKRPRGRETTAFDKFSNRQGMTIAVVSLAMRLAWNEAGLVRSARAVIGGASEMPVRALELERELEGCDPAELADACDRAAIPEITPISDLRASAEFRAHLTRVVAKRTCAHVAREAADVRDVG